MAGLIGYRGRTSTREGEFLTHLSQLRLLDGQRISATFAAKDSVTVPHSLGRPYLGAIVVASSSPKTMPKISALEAGLAAKQNVDPNVYLVLGSDLVWTGTVTLWVF